MMLTRTAVPKPGSPSPEMGFSRILSAISLFRAVKRSWSATVIRLFPLAVTAFRFFDPITAPMGPHAPAARDVLVDDGGKPDEAFHRRGLYRPR
jgi:hypothetical protein